ncbi:Flp pilus assembly protein CpaB [Nocardioides jensenii]|uniref:Flp pilus assembly protein CpaB n=1 Tax=Nocardioides jensenii TaxID=1843 RepID=UPI0008375B60|nr:Flp pilus assembly protein CpaB [Nocardioides jensenii]
MDRRKILLVLAAVIAAFGTLLVFLYAQGADNRAKEDIESVQVLKAVQTIEPGETFEDAAAAGKMEPQDVPKDQVLEGAQSDLTGLTGLKATSRILTGEQIVSGRWGGTVENTSLAIPDGMMAISVNLTDPARVAGFVSPGSEVSVFLTSSEMPQPAFTRMLLPRVQVLGVGTTSTITSTKTSDDGAQTTEQLPATLMTLALPQKDAQRVIFAAANGELAFGLLTDKTKVAKAPAVTANTLLQ